MANKYATLKEAATIGNSTNYDSDKDKKLVTRLELRNINCDLTVEGYSAGYDYNQCILLNHIEKYNTGQTKIHIYCERIGCLDVMFDCAICMTDQYGPWSLIENTITGSYFTPDSYRPYTIIPDNTIHTYIDNCYGCYYTNAGNYQYAFYGLGLAISKFIVYSNYIPEPTGIVYANIQITATYADGTFHILKSKRMAPITTKIVDTNSSGNHVYECIFENISPWNFTEGTIITGEVGVLKELNVTMEIVGDA